MIVIPMAGMSSRFQQAGYLLPKYMLDAAGKTLFAHAVGSFAQYFKTETFLFIYRNVSDTKKFIDVECSKLGIRHSMGVCLEEATRGQADTVAIGLREAGIPDDAPLTIFNIDTFRPRFEFPAMLSHKEVSGYLEVFEGEGTNWSFARTESAQSDRVVETAEKRAISKFCCTGLYHFSRTEYFTSAFALASNAARSSWDANELYVAPLYNHLIRSGLDIRIHKIDSSSVIFCGVPSEYDAFLESESQRLSQL